MQSTSTFIYILALIGGGFLGLISASIATHLGLRSADRMVGESRSPHCLYCLRPIGFANSFPLLGWLLRRHPLRFPCPCARRTGLYHQPIIEASGFILGIAAVALVGLSLKAIPLAIALGLLPAITLIDLFFGIIPDGHNLLLGLFGLAWLALGGGDLYIALIILAVLLALGLFCALIYSRWRGRDMLGLGDVKFFAAAALWLQPEMVPWFLGIAGFSGAIGGLIWQRATGTKEFPFGPALCFSLLVCITIQLLRTPVQ